MNLWDGEIVRFNVVDRETLLGFVGLLDRFGVDASLLGQLRVYKVVEIYGNCEVRLVSGERS